MIQRWISLAVLLGICLLGGCENRDEQERAEALASDVETDQAHDDTPAPQEPAEEVALSPFIGEEIVEDAPEQPVPQVTDEPPPQTADQTPEILQFTMTTLDGRSRELADYRGKVLLIVNTASYCGFTPQYAGLQDLHERFADEGLAVLGFPANNFGNQEPGPNEQIATFCQTNFGVSFDMFSKISVAGDDRHPLYDLLAAADAPPATPPTMISLIGLSPCPNYPLLF